MSKLYRLGLRDYLKGFLIAALGAFLTSMYAIVSNGALPTGLEWRSIALTAISAGLAYLIKNLFTNSENELFKKDPE